MKEYMRAHGKINRTIALPVDNFLKTFEQASKAADFNFNQWARDLLHTHAQDIIKRLGLELNDA